MNFKNITSENFSLYKNDLRELCFSVARNQGIKGYSVDDIDKIICNVFVDVVGTQNPTQRDLEHPIVKHELFKIIEETVDIKIQTGFANLPFFERFVEMRRVADGERIDFYVESPNNIVISEKSKGNWDIRRQRLDKGESFTLPIRTFGGRFYAEFKHILMGRITFGEMIDKIAKSTKEKLAETMAKEFMSTFESIPAEFKHTGIFDTEEMLKVVKMVKTANGGTRTIIAGTSGALDKITNSLSTNSFLVSNDMKDQINKGNILSEWRGSLLLEIPNNFKQGTYDLALDEDTLFVLTGDEKPIKLVQEGKSFIREVRDSSVNQDQTVEYQVDTNWGIGIVMNKIYGAYKLQ